MQKNLLFILLFIGSYFYSQENLNVKIYRENEKSVNHIYIDNEELIPISVEFNYTAINCTSTLPNKSIVLIPAKTKKSLVSTIAPSDPKKKSSFDYEVSYVMGDTNSSSYQHEYVYALPFKENKMYLIYQGYNGSFSHQNAYSLDFSLNEGEEVFASREGMVAYVIAENEKSCITKDCAKFANKIIIQHSDGSFAEYVHLKKNGAVVKVGDFVKKGDLIGYSGKTGWAKGPHLHFSVYYNNIDGTRKYMKTKFATAQSSTPILLSEKKKYSRNK